MDALPLEKFIWEVPAIKMNAARMFSVFPKDIGVDSETVAEPKSSVREFDKTEVIEPPVKL
jgi:hypothetical protein